MPFSRSIAPFACPSRKVLVAGAGGGADDSRLFREIVRGVAVDCYIRGLEPLASDLEALADGPREPTTAVYRSVVQRHWRWGELCRARYQSLLRATGLSPEVDSASPSVVTAR